MILEDDHHSSSGVYLADLHSSLPVESPMSLQIGGPTPPISPHHVHSNSLLRNVLHRPSFAGVVPRVTYAVSPAVSPSSLPIDESSGPQPGGSNATDEPIVHRVDNGHATGVTETVQVSQQNDEDAALRVEMFSMIHELATQQTAFQSLILHRLTRLEEAMVTIVSAQETLARKIRPKAVRIDVTRNTEHEAPVLNDQERTSSGGGSGGVANQPPGVGQPAPSDVTECPVCHKMVPHAIATQHVNQHFEKPPSRGNGSSQQQRSNGGGGEGHFRAPRNSAPASTLSVRRPGAPPQMSDATVEKHAGNNASPNNGGNILWRTFTGLVNALDNGKK